MHYPKRDSLVWKSFQTRVAQNKLLFFLSTELSVITLIENEWIISKKPEVHSLCDEWKKVQVATYYLNSSHQPIYTCEFCQ